MCVVYRRRGGVAIALFACRDMPSLCFLLSLSLPMFRVESSVFVDANNVDPYRGESGHMTRNAKRVPEKSDRASKVF